jgi:hypothetical protein
MQGRVARAGGLLEGCGRRAALVRIVARWMQKTPGVREAPRPRDGQTTPSVPRMMASTQQPTGITTETMPMSA